MMWYLILIAHKGRVVKSVFSIMWQKPEMDIEYKYMNTLTGMRVQQLSAGLLLIIANIVRYSKNNM